MGLVEKLELRVNALENLGRLSLSSRGKDSPDVSPLLSWKNITCLTDPWAIGALFKGGLAETVTISFALSALNMAIILVTGVVIYQRNYQIVFRTRVLEMKMGGHGENYGIIQRRGNGMFSQRGPCLPRLNVDICDAAGSSHISRRCPQPRMDRCITDSPGFAWVTVSRCIGSRSRRVFIDETRRSWERLTGGPSHRPRSVVGTRRACRSKYHRHREKRC